MCIHTGASMLVTHIFLVPLPHGYTCLKKQRASKTLQALEALLRYFYLFALCVIDSGREY